MKATLFCDLAISMSRIRKDLHTTSMLKGSDLLNFDPQQSVQHTVARKILVKVKQLLSVYCSKSCYGFPLELK